MGLQRLSHAELRVNDLEAAVNFHTATMGLVELVREDGRIYFGCGPGVYDVALRQGGTGVERFALSADDEDDLLRFAMTFTQIGVAHKMMSDPEPGVVKALRFQLPAGHNVDIATLSERTHYANPAHPSDRRTSIGAPIDLDHITLRVGERLEPTMDFLRDVLGFRCSDIVEFPNGDPMATWMHVGDYHHDVAAFVGGPGQTLDHLAWTMSSIDHIKSALDRIGRDAIAIEAGPGRHAVGGDIYAYLWAPGGNRYELSTEMPRAVDRRAPAIRWKDPTKTFSAWGAPFPESFKSGS